MYLKIFIIKISAGVKCESKLDGDKTSFTPTDRTIKPRGVCRSPWAFYSYTNYINRTAFLEKLLWAKFKMSHSFEEVKLCPLTTASAQEHSGGEVRQLSAL